MRRSIAPVEHGYRQCSMIADARDVQDDKMQDHDDENEPKHIRTALCACGRAAAEPCACAAVGIKVWAPGWEVGSLRRRTFLAVLAPPVRGQAPRLVHRERRWYEQHQQATSGVDHELDPHRAEIGSG